MYLNNNFSLLSANLEVIDFINLSFLNNHPIYLISFNIPRN